MDLLNTLSSVFLERRSPAELLAMHVYLPLLANLTSDIRRVLLSRTTTFEISTAGLSS